MPAKIKRASFTKSQSPVKASLTVESVPLPTIDETRPLPHLEEMLEAEAEESEVKKKNTFLYSIGIILTGSILSIAVIVYVSSLYMAKRGEMSDSPPVPVIIKPSPSPVPAPLTLEILNGSGVPGAAAKAAAKLSVKGYVILSTGNTKKLAKTDVRVSPDISVTAAAGLMADLGELFGVSSSSGGLTGSTASARITLGSK